MRTFCRLVAVSSLTVLLMATPGSVIAAGAHQGFVKTGTVYTCAKKKDGAIRIVKKSTKCKKSERKVTLALASAVA